MREDESFIEWAERMTAVQVWEDKLCWRCGELESEHYGLAGYCDPGEPAEEGRVYRDVSRVFAPEPLPMMGEYEIGSLKEELAWEAMQEQIEADAERGTDD